MSEANEKTGERRAFLRATGLAVVGAVAGKSLAAEPAAPAEVQAAEPATETTRPLVLKDHPDLQKVGGWKTIGKGREKLIVARTDTNSFVACSAICTHKGCEVEYAHDDKLFICPCHGARYDLQGNVVRGPAKLPLARHNIEAAALLEIAPVAAPSNKNG